MSFDNTPLPNKIKLTPINMKLFEIVHISHDKPEIKEKLMEVIDMLKVVQTDLDNWRSLMFHIANQIN